MKKKCLIGVVLAGVLCMIFGIFLFQQKYLIPAQKVIAKSTDQDFKKHQNSIIYDKDGKVLSNLSEDANSKYLIYQNIPKTVCEAFLAVEDRNFWEHPGIDAKGLLRVGVDFLKSGGKTRHGASTITQQLIRNTFLGKEVTMDRKLREIAYALALEQKYSKENILEFYINNVYFGNQQYGIEAAANYYFGKKSEELSVAEIAYLCAIPNAPTYYDPLQHPENTKKRQQKILKDMKEAGYLTSQIFQNAKNEAIHVKKRNDTVYDDRTSYAIYCAVKELMKQDQFKFQYHFSSLKAYRTYKKSYNQAYHDAKEKLYTGGYRIYTSFDGRAQQQLQQSIDQKLKEFKEKKHGIYTFQGAATCIDNTSGKVTAIVGGRSGKQNATLNRAFESKRQPGSTIKPILVYAPALDAGYQQGSVLQSVNVATYHSGMGGSAISMENALMKSDNGAAYWLANQIGIKNGLKYLEKMKFGSIVGEDQTLSSALGGLTVGVNTVEMASAYHCLFSDGWFVEPTCILKMEDADGIGIHFDEKPVRIYKETSAKQIISMMEKVISSGTAKSMDWDSKRFAAGKTGTTNDSKDGWFCGMTKKATVAVWVGYDTPKEKEDLYGGTYPMEIWRDFQNSIK